MSTCQRMDISDCYKEQNAVALFCLQPVLRTINGIGRHEAANTHLEASLHCPAVLCNRVIAYRGQFPPLYIAK